MPIKTKLEQTNIQYGYVHETGFTVCDGKLLIKKFENENIRVMNKIDFILERLFIKHMNGILPYSIAFKFLTLGSVFQQYLTDERLKKMSLKQSDCLDFVF